MSITTTHVANFQLRLQLLAAGIMAGAILGAMAGHHYIRQDLHPQTLSDFNHYLPARVKEMAGFYRFHGTASRDRHALYLQSLRTEQQGLWAEKFERMAQKAYVEFPVGGAIGMAVLVMLIGRRIGGVNGRSPA